ncbi:GH25 family lysozyme, partial [Liquorilactobacillus mali]
QSLKSGQLTLEQYYQQLEENYQSQSVTITNLNQRVNELASSGIFIDISSNNEDTSVEWFTKVASYGAKYLMVKLTQSTDYVNQVATAQIENGGTAGLSLIGCYHYFMGNGVAEGQAFLAQLQAKGIQKTAIVALDIEDSSINPILENATLTKSELNAQIAAFYKVLTDAGYINTCDYASISSFGLWFDSSAKLKWISDWDISSKPAGADAWQFTNNWNNLGVDASYAYNQIFI